MRTILESTSRSRKSHHHLYRDYDNPERVQYIRSILQKKYAIQRWYRKIYGCYLDTYKKIGANGIAIEIGSGASFAKEVLPNLITSDIIKYDGVDLITDAGKMPFSDSSLKLVVLCHVFHHIADPREFLSEIERCLIPGARTLIIDQHCGFFSSIILRYFHNEDWNPQALSWSFQSSGPLSGANGALSWVVFQRDLEIFHRQFPELRLVRYETTDPLYYWLAGGLQRWSLLP